MWSGEKAQIAVVSFDAKTAPKPPAKGKTKNNRVRNLLGRGMENQLVTTLKQAGQFSVLEPQTERSVRSKRANAPTSVRIANIEGAEFLLSGTVTKYLPSQESILAGIESDPLLSAFSIDASATVARSATTTFGAFTAAPEDRVATTLRLIDAKSGRLVSETTLETTAQDLGPSLEGIFGPELLEMSGELPTPMQKAVRANTIQAVNWIANNCLAYRKQLAENPPPSEPPKPLKRKSPKTDGN
jgi:curli biogenesis system outer membrane secretion channel CsgG